MQIRVVSECPLARLHLGQDLAVEAESELAQVLRCNEQCIEQGGILKATTSLESKKNLKPARANSSLKLTGPSYFEVEYLRQMKEELEIFLRSRGFSTIQEFQIAFKGPNYTGQMSIEA